MKQKYLVLLAFSFLLLSFFTVQAQSKSDFKTPLDFFGFQPGSEGNLYTYEQLIGYLQTLESLIQKSRTAEKDSEKKDS